MITCLTLAEDGSKSFCLRRAFTALSRVLLVYRKPLDRLRIGLDRCCSIEGSAEVIESEGRKILKVCKDIVERKS